MILTKVFILMVLPFIFTAGLPLSEHSENMPARSEIMSRIKRLLVMLKQKDYESRLGEQAPYYTLSAQRKRMLERRRKLEGLLEGNPGLRTLLKSVLEKRKAKEGKMVQSDACRPGLFYCDDRDSGLNQEESVRSFGVNKEQHMKSLDSGSYCPPGFFYCPNNQRGDTVNQLKRDRLKLLDEMFPKETNRQQAAAKSEARGLERAMHFTKDRKDSSKRTHTETGKRKVEFVRVPASDMKVSKSDDKRKASQGEKLVDDLVKSLRDTGSSKISDTNPKPANQDETNFDLKQLVELLEGNKR